MKGDDKQQVKFSLHSDHKAATKLLHFIMTRATTELHDTQIFQQICNVKIVQERNIFPVFSSKESEILHVKHSAIEQSLLQAVSNQNLIKLIGRLGYQ